MCLGSASLIWNLGGLTDRNGTKQSSETLGRSGRRTNSGEVLSDLFREIFLSSLLRCYDLSELIVSPERTDTGYPDAHHHPEYSHPLLVIGV